MKWHDAVSFRFEGDADAAVTYVPMARKLLGMFKHEISLGANLGTMVRRWTLLDGPEGQATITAHAFATHDIVTIDAVRPAGERKKAEKGYEPFVRIEVWSYSHYGLSVWEPPPGRGLLNHGSVAGAADDHEQQCILDNCGDTTLTDTYWLSVSTASENCVQSSVFWNGDIIATYNNMWMFPWFQFGEFPILYECTDNQRHAGSERLWKHYDELFGVRTEENYYCQTFAVLDPQDRFARGRVLGGQYAAKASCLYPVVPQASSLNGSQGYYIVRLGQPGADLEQYVYKVPLRTTRCFGGSWDVFHHDKNPHGEIWDQGAVLIDINNGAVTIEENYIPHMGFAASSG